MFVEAVSNLICVERTFYHCLAQGCIGQAIFAAYLWRIGQPKLLSTGPAPEHGAAADAQLAMLWMILARPNVLGSASKQAARHKTCCSSFQVGSLPVVGLKCLCFIVSKCCASCCAGHAVAVWVHWRGDRLQDH